MKSVLFPFAHLDAIVMAYVVQNRHLDHDGLLPSALGQALHDLDVEVRNYLYGERWEPESYTFCPYEPFRGDRGALPKARVPEAISAIMAYIAATETGSPSPEAQRLFASLRSVVCSLVYDAPRIDVNPGRPLRLEGAA